MIVCYKMSIVGSFSKEKLLELCEFNKPNSVYSIAEYDMINKGLCSVNRSTAPLYYTSFDGFPIGADGIYTIVWQQEANKNIQPAEMNWHHLWFDGEMKPQAIKSFKSDYSLKTDWPAYLLLQHILRCNGTPIHVDGTLACIYSDGRSLFLFRNEFGSLFIDHDFNLASIRFEGSQSVRPNEVLWMNFDTLKLRYIDEFETVKIPTNYYGEEYGT